MKHLKAIIASDSQAGRFARVLALLGLCVALPLTASAAPEFIVLDSVDWVDEVEPGATIEQLGNDGVPGVGAVNGFGVVFTCGTSDSADFSEFTSQFGALPSPEGAFYVHGCSLRPRDVVQGDPLWTAMAVGSGNLYDIEFKSFNVTNGCIDGDGGLSCAATGGRTSYWREAVAPEQPEVPMLSCTGFYSPMDRFPVRARGNRALPLKMNLFDEGGFEVIGGDLAAAPVVMVLFTSEGSGAEPVDVSADALAANGSQSGNEFEYTDEGIWQHNLHTRYFSAAGEYAVTMVSGDGLAYSIDPACVTSFVKQ